MNLLACKLFDLDVGHPGGDEPSRANSLDILEGTDERTKERDGSTSVEETL
jgi:hypothetical protein